MDQKVQILILFLGLFAGLSPPLSVTQFAQQQLIPDSFYNPARHHFALVLSQDLARPTLDLCWEVSSA